MGHAGRYMLNALTALALLLCAATLALWSLSTSEPVAFAHASRSPEGRVHRFIVDRVAGVLSRDGAMFFGVASEHTLERDYAFAKGTAPKMMDRWCLGRQPALRWPTSAVKRFARGSRGFLGARWVSDESYSPTVGLPTLRLSFLVIPHWLLMLATIALPAGRYVTAVRRRARRGLEEGRRLAGRCPRCGYDLRATPERCPECGTPAAANV